MSIAADQVVDCSSSLDCNSSYNSTLMSARECCVNSNYGLSYSIPGQPLCHNCIGMLLMEHSYYCFPFSRHLRQAGPNHAQKFLLFYSPILVRVIPIIYSTWTFHSIYLLFYLKCLMCHKLR